jgi:hypothetical protein
LVQPSIRRGGAVLRIETIETELGELIPNHDQTIRVGIRKRAEEHGVDDAKNRGAGTDAQG